MSERLIVGQEINKSGRQKVFASDIHGDHRFAEALVDQFPEAELHIIGDTIHPKNIGDTKQTVDTLVRADAKFYLGNGEDITASTLFIDNDETRLMAIKHVFLPTYTGGMFSSYGLPEPESLRKISSMDVDLLILFNALRSAILDAKHVGVFLCPLFFEDKNNLAIHAGVDPSKNWKGKTARRAELIDYSKTALEERDYTAEHPEIYDPGHILSRDKEVAKCLKGRTLITGHDDCSTDDAEARVSTGGRRIRIGRGKRGERFVHVLNSGAVTRVTVKR